MTTVFNKDYFAQQLNRLLQQDFDEIVRQRGRTIGIASQEEKPKESITDFLEIKDSLDQVRSEYWEASQEDLLKDLNRIDVKNFPEYGPVVEQMRRAVISRNAWDVATSPSDYVQELLAVLKLSVTSPSRLVSENKGSIFFKMQDYRKGHRYKDAAKTVRETFPKLYAFDPQWISQIENESRIGRLWKLIPTWFWIALAVAPIVALLTYLEVRNG